MRWIALSARVVLAGVFLYASATKLPDLHAFSEDVANYQLLPAILVPVVAPAVVGVELVAGIALLLGVWARAAAAVLGGLMLVFVVGLSQALLRGIDLRCGCFGGADLATWWTVARDVALLVPAIVVLRFGPGPLAPRDPVPLPRAG